MTPPSTATGAGRTREGMKGWATRRVGNALGTARGRLELPVLDPQEGRELGIVAALAFGRTSPASTLTRAGSGICGIALSGTPERTLTM